MSYNFYIFGKVKENEMQKRMYEAEVIENLISDVKQEFTNLMEKHVEDERSDLFLAFATGAIALNVLEDKVLKLEPETVEIK